MPLYKNWAAIAALSKNNLKAFLLGETDEEVLARMRVAYPECFSNTPILLKVWPVSILRAIAQEKSREEGNEPVTVESDGELEWFRALEPAGVPLLWFRREDGIPIKLWRQIVGQTLRGGIPVTWQDATYLVVGINSFSGLGSLITTKSEPDWLVLAPAEIIDLDT